jgi:hypothetical protein
VILYRCDIGTLALTGWIFAMRIGPFLQNTSIAEAMGDIYGKPVRVITTLFVLLVTIGLRFRAGEKIFSVLLRVLNRKQNDTGGISGEPCSWDTG